MSAPLLQPDHAYTFAEYLELEQNSEEKHDFYAGAIVLAMSGGTLRHGALAARIIGAMQSTARAGCEVFTSDVRVRVAATDRSMYPDVSMVCGAIETDPDDATRTTLTNPVLIVEVLSKTTEMIDRGDKWMHYQRIPTLQEYVLVSQEPRVEIFRRNASSTWEYIEVREGTVTLATGPTLDLATLYANLPD